MKIKLGNNTEIAIKKVVPSDNTLSIVLENMLLDSLDTEFRKNEALEKGRQIILWTCRCGNQLEEAVEWCRKWELEFDAVNENLPEIIERYGSDGRKIYADVYIDDKSCFPWEVKKDEKVGL